MCWEDQPDFLFPECGQRQWIYKQWLQAQSERKAYYDTCVDEHQLAWLLWQLFCCHQRHNFLMNQDCKVVQTVVQVNDLLYPYVHGDHFTAKSCNFNSLLFLKILINRHLIEQMKNTSDGVSSNQVMHENGIKVMCQSDILFQWWRCIVGKEFLIK